MACTLASYGGWRFLVLPRRPLGGAFGLLLGAGIAYAAWRFALCDGKWQPFMLGVVVTVFPLAVWRVLARRRRLLAELEGPDR